MTHIQCYITFRAGDFAVNGFLFISFTARISVYLIIFELPMVFDMILLLHSLLQFLFYEIYTNVTNSR